MSDDRNIVIRNATAADTLALAGLAMLAGHGLLEIFYGGLIPGKSTLEIVAERRIGRRGSFSEISNWRIAEDGGGQMRGGLNSFAHSLFGTAQPDPLLTEDRLAPAASLLELEMEAAGSYHINMIAVFPSSQRGGMGRALMAEAERLARSQGFDRMTLSTFEADTRLVDFYRRQGFYILATREIAPHPALQHGGN